MESTSARATRGTRYTLAERAAKNPVRVGICEHSSDFIDVTEVTKVDINKVAPGSFKTPEQVQNEKLYSEGQGIYSDGLLYFIGTVDRNISTPEAGRELFLIQSKTKNSLALGDWANDI